MVNKLAKQLAAAGHYSIITGQEGTSGVTHEVHS